MITFIIATRYTITFEGQLSGWLTTSSNKNAINAYENAIDISHTCQQDETIFTIYLRQKEPLQTFSFSIFKKDQGICYGECQNGVFCCTNDPFSPYCCPNGNTCCEGNCCSTGRATCCNGTCCDTGICCNGNCCSSYFAVCCNGTCCESGVCCNGTCCSSTFSECVNGTCCNQQCGETCCGNGQYCYNNGCVDQQN